MTKITTLRPGIQVSLKSTIKGNADYDRRIVEPERIEADGSKQAKWETEVRIADPEEYDAAIKVRGRARTIIRSICSQSTFGLLCPEAAAPELDEAIAEATKLVADFNAGAKLTTVGIYVLAGRFASDDAKAVRAINSEVRDLMAEMEEGVKKLDVEAIRKAASRAREMGQMLSPDAAAIVKDAITAARATATKIAAAGEQAVIQVDQKTLAALAGARTAFLDLDPAADVEAPEAGGGVAVDLMPADAFDRRVIDAPASPAFEME